MTPPDPLRCAVEALAAQWEAVASNEDLLIHDRSRDQLWECITALRAVLARSPAPAPPSLSLQAAALGIRSSLTAEPAPAAAPRELTESQQPSEALPPRHSPDESPPVKLDGIRAPAPEHPPTFSGSITMRPCRCPTCKGKP